MHRDIKISNILLDEQGYLKLINFGSACIMRKNQTPSSLSGTTAYRAPEIVRGQKYNLVSDWWSVGILLIQMLTSVNPYESRTKDQLYQKIKSFSNRQILPNKSRIPYSDEFEDLVSKLLHKDPKKRLGATGDASEVLKHSWFANINVEDLELRRIEPEFVPEPFSLSIYNPFISMKSGTNLLQEQELPTDKMWKV